MSTQITKYGNDYSYVHDEIVDRISSLTVSCPECETIIHSDDQYQCGTCNGDSYIRVLDWINEQLKKLPHHEY